MEKEEVQQYLGHSLNLLIFYNAGFFQQTEYDEHSVEERHQFSDQWLQ